MGRKLGKSTHSDEKLAVGEVKRIGLLLKKYRNDLGLTQEQVAEKIGSTTEAVRFIENGYRVPSLKTLLKIVDRLGMTLELRPKKLKS